MAIDLNLHEPDTRKFLTRTVAKAVAAGLASAEPFYALTAGADPVVLKNRASNCVTVPEGVTSFKVVLPPSESANPRMFSVTFKCAWDCPAETAPVWDLNGSKCMPTAGTAGADFVVPNGSVHCTFFEIEPGVFAYSSVLLGNAVEGTGATL